MKRLAACKFRHTGTHINSPGSAEITRRLQNFALLSVIQRNRLDIVKRELPQIHLPVLGIPKLHSVINNSGVIGAHRPDIDSLYTADPAVILDLHSGKIAQGVGHTLAVEPAQLLAVKALRGYDFCLTTACGHLHILQSVGQRDRIGRFQRLCHHWR